MKIIVQNHRQIQIQDVLQFRMKIIFQTRTQTNNAQIKNKIGN